MLIYGHIHYKHRARAARARLLGTRWKESLVQTQISHTRRLKAARMPKCRVWLATAKLASRLLLTDRKFLWRCQDKRSLLFLLLNDKILVLPPSRQTFPSSRTGRIIIFVPLAVALKLEPFIEKSNTNKLALLDKNKVSHSFLVSFEPQPAAFSSHQQGL